MKAKDEGFERSLTREWDYMNRYLLAAYLFFTFSLIGCTAITGEHIDKDNKKIYEIDCGGLAMPMSICHNRAKKLCPNGYKVISNTATPRSRHPSSPFDLSVSQYLADSIANKGITVKCA